MASGSSQSSNPSTQSTASVPSSSPPILIPSKKSDHNSSIPTPVASHETEPRTPDLRQRPQDHALVGQLPPTPGDAPLKRPKRTTSPSFVVDQAEAILERLKSGSTTRERLKPLTEETLMSLRAAIDDDTPLPFEVGPDAFQEWKEDFSDARGYEYDSAKKELKILTLAGPVHEKVAGVFNKWFWKIQETFQQEERMDFTCAEDYTLEDGSTMTPDGYIYIDISGPVVAIEVGLSQSFDKQVEKAEKWLLKGPARLVILIDVDIVKLGMKNLSTSFASSTSSTLSSQDALPYGITKQDLENPKVKELGMKIFNWHEDKTALAKLTNVNLYLYRRKPGNRHAINQDAKFVIFEEHSGFSHLESAEAFVTTDDLQIPTANQAEKIPLPLESLKACFGRVLRREQLRVAEKAARQVMKAHGLEAEASSFQPSSGAGEDPSHSQSLGSVREESDRAQTRQKKRRLNNPGDITTDHDSSFDPTQSFQTTSSGMFAMDPLGSSDAPQYSQRSSPLLPATDSQPARASMASFSSTVGSESSASQPRPKRLKRKKKA